MDQRERGHGLLNTRIDPHIDRRYFLMGKLQAFLMEHVDDGPAEGLVLFDERLIVIRRDACALSAVLGRQRASVTTKLPRKLQRHRLGDVVVKRRQRIDQNRVREGVGVFKPP